MIPDHHVHQDLDNRFDYHAPPDDNPVFRQAHEKARAHVKLCAVELNKILPDGREKSLVLTKLEEAMFWANAAIARAPIDVFAADGGQQHGG